MYIQSIKLVSQIQKTGYIEDIFAASNIERKDIFVILILFMTGWVNLI